MNYHQTLQFLFSQLPMYQRIGSAAYKADLTNTIALCNILKNPQNNFKSVHIAGTNGKGSVSHLLSSVLQTKGLKVGLYTSPHLKDFRERIKINGKSISRDYVCSFVKKHRNDFESIRPSFFEMTVGMAFNYFSDEKIDIAVVETGMGGRLDSTNIINPVLSVITNIGIDHIQFLGNTLAEIAVEKAGIIKQNTPVVIGETQHKIKSVFIDKARQLQAPLYFADEGFEAKNISFTGEDKPKLMMDMYRNGKLFIKNLRCSLLGLYQPKNIVTVFRAIEILNQLSYNIDKTDIIKGINNVSKNTGLAGRWQIISKSPLTVCDVGHNEDGIKQVLKQIQLTPHKHLHIVFGTVNDKDIDKILKLLPSEAAYYFCKADIPRGLDENELTKKAVRTGLKGKAYPSVKEALHKAQTNAGQNDLVFVGGSTFVVAEVI